MLMLRGHALAADGILLVGHALIGSAGAAVVDQAAVFGAATVAGAGGFQPVASDGGYVDLASYDGVQSGDITGFTPSVSGGRLVFDAPGAPDGAVLLVTPVGHPQIAVTVSQIAGQYDVASHDELETALLASTYGGYDIVPRPMTDIAGVINKDGWPAGTFDGTNHVAITARAGQSNVIRNTGTFDLRDGNTLNDGGAGVAMDGLDVIVSPGLDADNGLPYALNVYPPKFKFSGTLRGENRVTPRNKGERQNVRHGINLLSTSTGSEISNARIEDARNGILTAAEDTLLDRVTFNRCTQDHFAGTGRCKGLTVRGCKLEVFIREAGEFDITGVTAGNPTIIQCAAPLPSWIGGTEGVALWDAAGLEAVLGTQIEVVTTDYTAGTLTLDVDTTGMTWTGGGGIEITSGKHADFGQIRPLGTSLADDQDNILIVANDMSPKAGSYEVFAMPQGVYGGADAIAIRDNFKAVGNLTFSNITHAINVQGTTNGDISYNTAVRSLGLDIYTHTGEPTITVAAGQGNVVEGNIACNFAGEAQVGGYQIALTDPKAVPAAPADIALYESLFTGPITEGLVADAVTPLTPKAGGAVEGLGAIPYSDFDAGTFADPRIVPTSFTNTSDARLVDTVATGAQTAITGRIDAASIDQPASIGCLTEVSGFKFFGIWIKSDGSLELNMRDGGGAYVMNLFNTAAGIISFGVPQDIVFCADYAAGTFKLWVNGVLSVDQSGTPATGLTSSSRILYVFSEDSAANVLTGSWQSVDLWLSEVTTDGTVPAAATYKSFPGDPAVVNADPWKAGTEAFS